MNFVVAFKGEAQPLIDFYQLEKVEDAPYPLFRNDQHCLIISGLGRDSATSATSALHLVTNKPNLGWMNLGVAGHGSLEVGEALSLAKSSMKAVMNPFILHKFLNTRLQSVCYKPAPSPAHFTNRTWAMIWKLMPFIRQPHNMRFGSLYR